MKIGIKISTDQNPNFPIPNTTDEVMVKIQLTNLNMVTMTMTGTFPTLIKFQTLSRKPNSAPVSGESISVTSPISPSSPKSPSTLKSNPSPEIITKSQ